MAWSDARCRVFDADFKLTLFFREIPAEAAEPPPAAQGLQGLQGMSPDQGVSAACLPGHAELNAELNAELRTRKETSTRLGAWREIPPPQARTLSLSAQYRGVQRAAVISREIFTIDVADDLRRLARDESRDLDDDDSFDLAAAGSQDGANPTPLIPMPDSLCVAPGPAVRHDGVKLACLHVYRYI